MPSRLEHTQATRNERANFGRLQLQAKAGVGGPHARDRRLSKGRATFFDDDDAAAAAAADDDDDDDPD
eukprot:11970346-Alexandrium_andersonii.AAC.1